MEAKENILEELEVAQLRKQQSEHETQLLENRKQHLERKADRQRTHHLCNMGGAIQSISKEAEFFDESRVLLIDGIGLCFTCKFKS